MKARAGVTNATLHHDCEGDADDDPGGAEPPEKLGASDCSRKLVTHLFDCLAIQANLLNQVVLLGGQVVQWTLTSW